MPVGPDAVRRAVLDAAAELFVVHGVPGVTLRDVARRARVNLGLINRYLGSRDEMIRAVFRDLNDQLVAEIRADPTASRGFEADTVMVRWTRVLTYLMVADPTFAVEAGAGPLQELIGVIQRIYGQAEDAARLRVAQLMGSALGWRLFEPFLMESAGLDADSIGEVRADLTGMHRRLAATPLPSPSDPPIRD
ncbi:MAG: TetR/AcrR family transcriptional regulator [Actinobacteria bacterium]|nr:TetR/AcrR family transcriptional regulator [Actinomycetota bacterium]